MNTFIQKGFSKDLAAVWPDQEQTEANKTTPHDHVLLKITEDKNHSNDQGVWKLKAISL